MVTVTEADARIADFRAFDGTTLPEGVRVFGPEAHDAKPSIDFEPEYITSSITSIRGTACPVTHV